MQPSVDTLKQIIEENAIRHGSDIPVLGSKKSQWLFDFRSIMLRPSTLELICSRMRERLAHIPAYQIGGLETAAIPLVTAIVYASQMAGAPHNGFYIRKSRKKSGLLQMIEGVLTNEPVVLIDDLMNSGRSMLRQIEIMKEAGKKVVAVCVIVRFRDTSYYETLRTEGIEIISLFTLSDFGLTLSNNDREKKPLRTYFKILWRGKSPNPNHYYVVPKSAPVLDTERVYFGSDGGYFWAINQTDGSIAWKFKVGPHAQGKSIFSSPALYNDTVYFGSYDGNVYALDTKTGAKRWIFSEADWVGSSPVIAPDLGLAFIGLEYGLWHKRGGIVALDLKTGKKRWQYDQMPAYTHSSPLYIRHKRQVVIGSNDGAAYLFNAKTGALIWKYATGIPTTQELDTGFSAHDIKASFAYDTQRDLIIFGNMAGVLSLVDRKTGSLRGSFKAKFGFFSTPLIHGNTVLAASVDKHLYCINLDTFQETWRWHAGARIFASPIEAEGSIFIGANTGRFTEINPSTGKERGFLQLTERITNAAAYNPITQKFFIPTFANEIYCVERDTSASKSD